MLKYLLPLLLAFNMAEAQRRPVGQMPVIWGKTIFSENLTPGMKFGLSDLVTACESRTAGTMRWNGTAFQMCDGGGSWASMGGGGGVSYPLLAPDGSAAAPSYAFSTNPGVGVYYVNADTSMNMAFGTTATLKFKGNGIFPIAGGLDIGTQTESFDDIWATRFQMGSGGQVIFRNATNSISFVAPSGLAGNFAYTLPLDDGTSGQFLQTDGSGVLTWASAGGSTPDPLLLGDGNSAAPTYSFANATGSGMWMGGSGHLIFGDDGFNVLAIVADSSGALRTIQPTQSGVLNGSPSAKWAATYSEVTNSDGGSAANPGFAFNGTSGLGMYTGASDTLSFATQGTERLRLNPSGGFLVGDDGIAFFGDAGTGLNHPNGGEFSFLSSGSIIVKVAPDGLRLQNSIWLAGKNPSNSTVNIARIGGSGRIEVGDGSHDVYTSAADVSVSTTGTQYLSSGAGINMNIAGGTLLVQGNGVTPVNISLGNADNTAHALINFSGLTDTTFPLPTNDGVDGEVLTRTGPTGTTWAGAPQGTVCGWYDVGTTTLVSSCKGSDPSVSCPTGYTQKTTAIVDFCVAN